MIDLPFADASSVTLLSIKSFLDVEQLNQM